jgi:hypothetical protein
MDGFPRNLVVQRAIGNIKMVVGKTKRASNLLLAAAIPRRREGKDHYIIYNKYRYIFWRANNVVV